MIMTLSLPQGLRADGETSVHLMSKHLMCEVHRDVKTENILLQSGGVPMLADFGFLALVLIRKPCSGQKAQTNGANTP